MRPRSEPAATIYDAIIDEASHRKERTVEEWQRAEIDRVWREARDWSEAQGLPVLPVEVVERCERQACGHVDYVEKWAYGIREELWAATEA